MSAEIAYETLMNEYDISDDNVTEYRYALSHVGVYSEYVGEQADKIIESIDMGQSPMVIGELLRPLYYATHKLVAGNELCLPGADHFLRAAASAYEALQAVCEIAMMTEDWATCQLSCHETEQNGYV